MKSLILFSVVLALAGCASKGASREYSRESHQGLFEALDSMPDGTERVLNEKLGSFRIRSTHADANRLCRLVELRLKDEFVGESFCKAKGGEWR